jgi:hypothetical protein
MNKLIIGLVAFVLLAAGGALAGGAISDSSPAADLSTGNSTSGTTTDGTTTIGTTTAEDRTTSVGDLSGPCDEAEHANDPRCAGTSPGAVTTAGDDRHRDRSGPNRGSDDDRAEDGDRHGRNRGGDDAQRDDRGGDDHDNSGPGSSGSDD